MYYDSLFEADISAFQHFLSFKFQFYSNKEYDLFPYFQYFFYYYLFLTSNILFAVRALSYFSAFPQYIVRINNGKHFTNELESS